MISSKLCSVISYFPDFASSVPCLAIKSFIDRGHVGDVIGSFINVTCVALPLEFVSSGSWLICNDYKTKI